MVKVAVLVGRLVHCPPILTQTVLDSYLTTNDKAAQTFSIQIQIVNLLLRKIPPKFLEVKVSQILQLIVFVIQSSNAYSNNFQTEIFYQVCGKSNYTSQKCWYLYDFLNRKEVPKALATTNINKVPDSNWYADTGPQHV